MNVPKLLEMQFDGLGVACTLHDNACLRPGVQVGLFLEGVRELTKCVFVCRHHIPAGQDPERRSRMHRYRRLLEEGTPAESWHSGVLCIFEWWSR